MHSELPQQTIESIMIRIFTEISIVKRLQTRMLENHGKSGQEQ